MCFFQLFAALLQRLALRTIAQHATPLDSSFLSRLHPETVIQIAQYLPRSSAASLALCCHATFNILGAEYLEALRSPSQKPELRALLLMLERDFPSYILCHHCTVLHKGTGDLYKGHTDGLKPCRKIELQGGVFKYIHHEFNFGDFQMAMKHYRLGLDYHPLLDLLSYRFSGRKMSVPYQCIAEARIIAGSILLQVQEVLSIPSSQPLSVVERSLLVICPHIGTVASDREALLPENVECKLSHEHNLKECRKASELKQCKYCPTEYKIDLQERQQHGVDVIITRWLDLGEGQSILDPKWWSHLSASYTEHDLFTRADGIYKKDLKDRPSVPFEAGSIRALYEQDVCSSNDPLPTSERVKGLVNC